MSYGNFKLWKLSFHGILVNKHTLLGPTSLVKSDFHSLSHRSLSSFLSSSSFFFYPFLFLLVSPLSLFFFLFLFRAKSHPHWKTKESQPSSSIASLLQSACRSLSFTLPKLIHSTNNISMLLDLGLFELRRWHDWTRMVVVGSVSLIVNPKHPISKWL